MDYPNIDKIDIDKLVWLVKNCSKDDLLCQVAEESSELSQAALKLRRAIGVGQYTPISPDEARDNLSEECADVLLCMLVYVNKDLPDGKSIHEFIDNILFGILPKKLDRWYDRMTSDNTDILKEDNDAQL